VSCSDPNPVVGGQGIALLRKHGLAVVDGILAEEGKELIRYFYTYMTKQRPHVILKFVQSQDGFIGKADEQVWLSNSYERVMVHKMRSEIDAILVGTNTACIDNPELTTRFYEGRHPLRVVIDRTGRIPQSHHLFDGSTPTLLFTESDQRDHGDGVEKVVCRFDAMLPKHSLSELYRRRIQSLLIEGGAQLIRSFQELRLWDEAMVVKTPKVLGSGVRAPVIEGRLKWRYDIAGDEVLAIAP
jgi:diaminohydroxyphosphoribosylaminopyrimidine deaminase/5-amino-6-(5-phosphoribosylamino)uracil reductase